VGHLGHEHEVVVDPDRPELDRLGDPHAAAGIGGPDRRRQPEPDVVRPLDRLLLVGEPLDRDDRPEHLVLDDLAFLVRADDDGRLVERAGAFYEPTVIAGPDQKSEIVQDEVFGPVVTVQRFSDEEQAIKWANDVRFGLAASVWTSDAGRGMRVAKAIQFGTVWINDHFMLVSEMPHGGFKESGYGKDQSMYAVEDYTVVKHVMLKI
jgi:acyl-CoA reductase-like NAD-dependent aldehyde dehydrogenase